MIDLSFLTEVEKEAILKVLNRDSELKKAEEQRVRHLHNEVNDENELKYKSGQWFYEAKSRRHRDKIHGADLVRASIRKRKNPATIAELSQSSKDKSQRRWVNSVNQDLFIPPELYGVMEPPDEAEEDLMPTNVETIQSARIGNLKSPEMDKDLMKNGTASPAKQRKNPFNSEGGVDEIDLHNGPGLVNGQVGNKSDIMSSIIKYGVKLPYPSPIGGRKTSMETEEDPSLNLPPVPKPRKLLINGKPQDRSNSSLQREDSLNKRKGILKRRSSSSSTDSESIRILPNVEALKLVLPASPILEAEQTPIFDDQMTSSENSPDRLKQVRFSEYVLQKPPTPIPESYNALEIGEFGILDPCSYQHNLDNEFLDHPPNEEPKPMSSDVDYTNSTENLDIEENASDTLTLQTPPCSSPILDVEKKPEDPSQELNYYRIYEIPDESYPEKNIDSAGTEPLYAVVKKPTKSTSPDQEKDFETEPRFLGQRRKIENAYQIEKTLEFGKSYSGDGKINFGSRNTTIQPSKVYSSTNEDFLAPQRSSQVQSSYDDEPNPSDYIPKWRRPLSQDDEDSLTQPTVQEFPDFRDGDTFVKPYSENKTNYKYSPVEYNKDTQYRSIFLSNTPDIEITPSSNFPVSQNLPSSSKPVSEDFKTHEIFLHDNRERRDLPKSANFKVMSMKERIYDMPREQMSNPSQFQSLKHFWNVEDKNQSKGDGDTPPNKILTDVLKRNKPTRADLKQRNSKDIAADDLSLPSSFDSSLSEEEQTSHKVASWLAHTPTVYGDEQVDANEDLVHPREEVMESINKTLIDRNFQTKDFSSALQKLKEEALEAPKISESDHLRGENIWNSPFKEPYLLDDRKKMTTILVNPTEKRSPTSGFYDRVVQISKESPEKETKTAEDIPSVTSKQYREEEIEENIERTVAPAKTESELKIVFQKLVDEYESNKSDDEPEVEESNLPNEKQQLVEAKEVIERSYIPKGNDHQEFISALGRLEIEASTPPLVEDEHEQPKEVLTLNTASPVKSSFKIGFEHMMPNEDDPIETPQKNYLAYTVQSYPPYFEERNLVDEVVENTTAPSRKDEEDLRSSLKKLELEAALIDPSGERKDDYEKTQPLQSTRNVTTVDSFTIPSSDVQKMPSPSYYLEKKSNLEDLYSNRTKKPIEQVEDPFVIKAKEKPKYSYEEKLPVEEEPLQKTIVKNEESSIDFRNQIMRLEEEAAASAPEEPDDQSVGDTLHVSPAPMKEVFISKKVFSNNESLPTKLPQPQPYAYDEMANSPKSPSDQTGSFTGSTENVLYKKPGTPSEKSDSKKGKPAFAGSQSDSNSSKHDKYTLEGMKAQDESISKVLDWFSRRSDSFDDQLPSIGLLERSKTSPQQITHGGKLEDDAFEPQVNESEDSQKKKSIPETTGIFDLKEDQKTINSDQPSPQKITYTNKMEDDCFEPEPNENEDLQKIHSIGKMAATSESIDDMKPIPPDQASTQQFITYTDKSEDDASEPQVNENEASQQMKSIHQITRISDSREDQKTIASDQPSTQLITYTDKMEDDASKSEAKENEASLNIKSILPMAESKEDLNTIDPDKSGIETMLNSSPIEYEAITPQKVSLTEFLEFGKSGSGCGKIQNSPINDDDFSQNYPELSESEKLEKDKDSDHNMTTSIPIEDEAFPTQQLPLTEFLAFGKSGSGCGKAQSSSINEDSSQKYPQLPTGEVFEKDKESLENEECRVLKEKVGVSPASSMSNEAVDEKEDQREALASTLEKSEDPSSKKSESDESNLQQMRVSDIKLLWEGGRPSPDATKPPVLSNTKGIFSPIELSVTPKSISLDSDDQNNTSLVTFKKVILEDEEVPMYPVDQLKSFWENEKNKETVKEGDDKGATTEEPRSNFKKWHTIQHFFNEEKSTDLMKKHPGRSISLGESADNMKSASFQNLKTFWNTSSKSDNKGTNQAHAENTKNLFGSNPDISKESFVSRAKGILAAKSLQDIRGDPSAVSQYQVFNAVPLSKKFFKVNEKNEYTRNAVNEIKTEKNSSSTSGGKEKLRKPLSLVNVMAQESLLPTNHSKTTGTIPDNCEAKQGLDISDVKQMALTDIMEKSADTKIIEKNEISLKLKTQDKIQSPNFNLPDKGTQSPILENSEDQNVYRDEENGEINEKCRKMLLVKQNGFDSISPVFSNVSESVQQYEENISEKEPIRNEERSNSSMVVNENIEKTAISLKKDLSDFDRKLQNLYKESLNLEDSPAGDTNEPEYVNINEPDENFSKVQATSSGNEVKNIQSSGGQKSHKPLMVNISSKKTELGVEDLSKTQPDSPTETSLTKHTHSADVPTVLAHLERQVDISPSQARNITSEGPTSELKGSLATDPEVESFLSEPNDCKVSPLQPEKISKKEIIERIEMPVILPRIHCNYFDEKLKQLYEESQNSEPNLKETIDSDVAENVRDPSGDEVYLCSTEPKKTFLKSSSVNLESSETVLSHRETLTDESSSPAILVQEVNETIEKTVAPRRISTTEGLEKLQKEALSEEEGGIIGNVAFGHVALNESQSEMSDPALGKNSVSEAFPSEKDTVQEETEATGYEEHQEIPSETSVAFMSNRQSTPVKDQNSSLRRSTLELYLETPYRREISKSIDVDISGYVTSDVNKCMDESNPILKALKRSAAKTLNAKAVQEVSPTSTSEDVACPLPLTAILDRLTCSISVTLTAL